MNNELDAMFFGGTETPATPAPAATTTPASAPVAAATPAPSVDLTPKPTTAPAEFQTLFQAKADFGKLDLSQNTNYKEQEPVPSGTYPAKIKSITWKISNSNTPMIVNRYEILEGDHKGRSVFETLFPLKKDGTWNAVPLKITISSFQKSHGMPEYDNVRVWFEGQFEEFINSNNETFIYSNEDKQGVRKGLGEVGGELQYTAPIKNEQDQYETWPQYKFTVQSA